MGGSYRDATGKVEITLKNDVMFHIVMQKSEAALRGLICALLSFNEKDLTSIVVKNPILFGDHVDDKEIVLDVELELNNNEVIDIEVQVRSNPYWTNRAVFYVSRLMSSELPEKDYSHVKRVRHIGILDFDLFGESEGFYSTYGLMNLKTQRLFSDKLEVRVLNLKRTDRATEEDRRCGLVHWAGLFRATTWEEIRRLAGSDHAMEEAAKVMYTAITDEQMKSYMLRREIAILDRNTFITAAREEGEARGIEIGEARGIEIGEAQGRLLGAQQKLVAMVCRKLAKGKTAAQIAEDLEENLEEIEAIVKAAAAFAPDYDPERVQTALNAVK